MSYFGFLLRFLGIPILILLGLTYWDHRQGQKRLTRLSHWPAALGIFLHILIALLYTTPWDNYLVATKVWWYDPDLVTGRTLGWVPIEEYTFFIVQPILGGLWLWFLARRLPEPNPTDNLRAGLRWQLPLICLGIWLSAVAILITRWEPGTYLALELGWALPPIILQLAFGADILWRYRRLVFLSLVPLTLYLSAADALAINLGTWTINPSQSLNLLLGGILPIEEFIFFLLTNILITFGLVLLWATESHQRMQQLRTRFFRSRQPTRNGQGQSPITNI
jgi:lycopene cyclase domain-containing protein